MKIFLVIAITILSVFNSALAEGFFCPSYMSKLQNAIQNGNIDERDGASYYLGMIKSECSASNAARAEKLVEEARANIIKEQKRAAAEARSADSIRKEENRIAEEKQRELEARREEQADEDDWNNSDADGCRNPISISSCDALQAYLKAHPTGKHVDEASQCLKEAEPRLAALEHTIELQKKSKEDKLAKSLLTSKSLDSLHAFINSFPQSIYIDTINSRISIVNEIESKNEEARRIYCNICEDYRAIKYNRSALQDEKEVSRRSGLVNQTAIYKINKTIYYIEKEIANYKSQYIKITGKQFNGSSCKECEEN